MNYIDFCDFVLFVRRHLCWFDGGVWVVVAGILAFVAVVVFVCGFLFFLLRRAQVNAVRFVVRLSAFS